MKPRHLAARLREGLLLLIGLGFWVAIVASGLGLF